ncbi:type I polyketide synthase [Acuticoccus sp. I52.16.1]|uniref:type I polyketide synthase n=1 Tax=Acuticoccus sp. I52.16.1 TaxID=2928472 RepID=UPI001FD3961E|nr:type I polyketide synthase [Acuticoccus sp. I52.16.1]UOM34001.1 SDR family NAD(P)-dependent oxidoreductase [Acuticoccus sp. I52.16.1]
MTVTDSRVALVGSACRLPQAEGLEAFWDVLVNAKCVISSLDEERFGTLPYLHPDRSKPGRSVTFAAGQIARPYHFDPGYFGISPREAATMDPQQRVLLEVAVEALENAGIPADRLAGQQVGVYVGASSLDYSNEAQLDPMSIEPQSMTGNTLSIVANRVSYVFDLRGPSYTVDTACSSSLIALHQAIEDIRAGKIETAIVGGVSLLLNHIPFIGFSRASMLSAGGLCRAFDAGADGYVRSEGAVVMVLRSEEAARRDSDPIRARFVGSGINADGRTAGLSLPSPTAQADLLRQVYEAGGIDPARLAFVEAHGTGTRVGDPIETNAIGTVLGQKHGDPLLIGSSKTNFGHLEPASGLVGILKSQLALANNLLPASLHFEVPNPDIDFTELNLTVAAEATTLARAPEPRLAGINSFGFGGANAHVVMADGEPIGEAAAPKGDAPLVVSAATRAALGELAAATAKALGGADAARLAAHVNAAAHRRQRLSHRAVIASDDASAMVAALNAVAEGQNHPLAAVGEAASVGEKPVFVYSGNGSQWAGMGRAAYQGETDFRLSFDRTDRLFMSVAGWSLVTMLFSGDLETEIERTEIAQPLLFAIQVALTDALERRGVTPSAVMGHSVGEVAAAWASGALSLSDAVKVIHARSTHQEVTRHLGGMAALLLPAEEAVEAIAPYHGLELAAVNSSRSVTISGPTEQLAVFGKDARKKRWAMKRLDLDYPFHCALVEPIRGPLLQSLSAIAPRPTTIPMISTVTGEPVDGTRLGADYWWENVRQPVDFQKGVLASLEEGHRLYVEIGPRPVLTGYLNDALRTAEIRATVLPSFRQGEGAAEPVAEVLRTLIANGTAIDDAALFGERRAAPDLLPTYPWQHQRYKKAESNEIVWLMKRRDHVLLGDRVREDIHEWRIGLDPVVLPFLADHTVETSVVFPAAGFTEMLLAVGRVLYPGHPVEVRGLDIIAPLVLDASDDRTVRTREIAPQTFVIESRIRGADDGWSPHVKATVAKAPAAPHGAAIAVPEGAPTVPAARLYEITAQFGLPYGPVFRRANLVTLVDDSHIHVRLSPPDPATARLKLALDPTMFDACFHGLFAFLAGRDEVRGVAVLPIRLGRLTLAADAATPTEADITVRRPTEGIVEADFVLRDAAGAVVATAEAVRFQAVPLAHAVGEPVVAAPKLRRVARVSAPASDLPPLAPSVDTATEPSETALFVEAGVLAAAVEALGPILTPPASLQSCVAEGRLAGNAVPLAARVLPALVAAGLAEEDGGTFALTGEPVDISEIVTLLIEEHPERLAEATLLAALPEWLAETFRSGLAAEHPASDALLDQLLVSAPFTAPLYAAIGALTDTALSSSGAALTVCLVGAGNVAFAREVAALIDPERVRLTITDTCPVTLERTALVWDRHEGVHLEPFSAAREHRYDLVVMTPQFGPMDVAAAAECLRPGGRLLGGALAGNLFADVIGGLTTDWWAASLDAESPVGALNAPEEWTAALTEAGLEAIDVHTLPSDETDAMIFTASRAAGVKAPTLETFPALVADGPAAGRTLEALRAMADDAPELADLTATPDGPVVLAVDVPEPADLPARLAAVGSWLVALGTEARTVTLVTFGAQVEGAKEVRPTAAAVSAFGRVAMNEFPHLDIRLVDIAASFDASEAAVRLMAELVEPNGEREIVLSSDHRSVMRYVPLAEETAGEALTLAVPRRGSIDNLVWSPTQHPPLGAGDVRIKVEASGLNFRDVMWTLGLLPHEALEDGFAGPTLGMECAGVVEAVGEEVTDVKPGDLVLAFAPQSFASHVTVTAQSVIPRPVELAAEAAATMPVAFLTAYYALIELAHLEEDETVLIHGGAGGVGLAALQIAKWRGARVFVTAGTPEKRALLRELGADEVFDSRGLTFAEEAKAATDGEGVDVVLNSLAGEAMERSLDTLKPFGRFCELGKRDFYADTKLGLRPFRQNLSYFGIDADQLMKHRPKVARRVLGQIVAMMDSGDLTPLPYRPFDAGGVKDAYRLMQAAGHIGKIVVTPPQPVAPTVAHQPVAIVADKAYLLVGGVSGFGFRTAEWLIEHGAEDLVLVSRSGVKDQAVAEAIEAYRGKGIAIDVRSLDVTNEAAVRELVAEIGTTRPLGGVFHMAMVLDDALIASLDAGRFETAMHPKIAGANALEAATADIPLDLFVLYSSITVQLGNPGQANYVAANAYLEAIARRRRARGQAGLTIAWGAIADAGVFARSLETSDLLRRKLGRHAITAGDGLAVLKRFLDEGAMTSGPAVRLIGQVDWATARKELIIARSPAFEDLADAADADGDDAGSLDLAERIAGLSPSEAVAEVTRLLAVEISRILKMPASEVDPHKPLTTLGMDSLMGVELRMSAEQKLGVDIPLMSLTAGATLADIAKKVVHRTTGEEASDEDQDELIARHIGSADAPREAIEAAVRERTAGVRTILS